MAYQRKKRSQEQIQKSPAPTAHNSLFATPALDMDDTENSLSDGLAKDSPTLEERRKMASRSSFDFGSIPLFPKGATEISGPPRSPLVQAKLTVGPVGDAYEQEADRVAAQVVETINRPEAKSPVQRRIGAPAEGDDALQRKPVVNIQRMCHDCEEDLQKKPDMPRVGEAGGAVSPDLEAQIQSAKGGGQALAPDLQQSMGEAMRADFSTVKVHADSQADRLNQSIQAKAFTTGSDIFFRQGAYDPDSQRGQGLIAHELTHVVQQKGGAVRRSSVRQRRGEQIPTIKPASLRARTTEVYGKLPAYIKEEGGRENANSQAIKARDRLQSIESISRPRKEKDESMIQRQLDDDQKRQLAQWLAEQQLQDLKLHEDPQVQAANGLEEAKQLARNKAENRFSEIDQEAQQATERRKAMIKQNLIRWQHREGKAKAQEAIDQAKKQIEILSHQLEELESGGVGRDLPVAIASLTEVLLHNYAPTEYTYIMMGNSPAPLMAWLRLNNPNAKGLHLPLGGLTGGNAPSSRESWDEILKTIKGQKIFETLDFTIGDALEEEKGLVLVDFVSSGGSMIYATDIIKAWLERAHKGEKEVKYLGYTEEGNEAALQNLREAGVKGVLATAMGECEKAFARMNADKIYKKALLILGPESGEIIELIDAANPFDVLVQTPAYYARVLKIMQESMADLAEHASGEDGSDMTTWKEEKTGEG